MTQDAELAAAVAEATRRLAEMAAPLYNAPGPKALLRRFGEAAHRHCGVVRLDCARISGRGSKLTLKRRGVRVPGVEAFGDDELARLAEVLATTPAARAELDAGLTELRIGDRRIAAAALDDVRGTTLVAWEPPVGDVTPLARLSIEQLVRVLQNEGRWLRKLDKTEELLYQDDLTGLYNYRYLEFALDAELKRAERFQNQFCLLFLDLDGFKPVNDQHGHLAGSSVLKQVAEVLREAVREVDVPIRYGGDEFVVLLLGATCAKGVLAAERVRRRIEAKAFQLDGGATARLTCSIGVAAFPEHGRDRATLLKMADETMYDSKRAGKNRVTVVGRAAGL